MAGYFSLLKRRIAGKEVALKAGLIFAAVILLGLSLSGCGQSEQPVSAVQKPVLQVDGEKALQRVADFISVVPRHSGSEGVARATEYLRHELAALGLEAEIDEFTDATPAGEIVFRNVTAEIPGKGENWIVIGSHYDAKAGISETFAGANDSGSSTGLLLELAEILASGPKLDVNLLLAFFDGEECIAEYGMNDGLHGSTRLASKLTDSGRSERVKAVIVIDMIGDRDLDVLVAGNSTPALASRVFKAARVVDKREYFSLGRAAFIDDHAPFLKAGMPSVLLIDFTFGSKPGRNDYWHTPEDTLDKLSAKSLETVGNVVLAFIRGFGEV